MTTDETGKIIALHAEGHLEVHDLLPWYVTGRLDTSDRAKVETHLTDCADCQAEARFQRRLDAEVVQLPLDVEQSWRQMQRQLGRETPGSRGRAGGWLQDIVVALKPGFRNPAPWLGWAVASVAVLVSAGTLLRAQQPVTQPAAYRTLSSGPADTDGNVVVMFRPATPERTIRATLNAVGARIVDGPTATDGYVLHVAGADRTQALANLRRQTSVTLAQPLDPGPRP